jgi:hypothetical protein
VITKDRINKTIRLYIGMRVAGRVFNLLQFNLNLIIFLLCINYYLSLSN